MVESRKEIVKVLAEGINRYFGSSIEQGMGMLEVHLRFKRWERQLKLFDRAGRVLEERGKLSPSREIPQKFLLPYLEASSLEEDQELQDRWAYLLANAADADCPVQLKRSFISIMESVTPIESKLFEDIARHEQCVSLDHQRSHNQMINIWEDWDRSLGNKRSDTVTSSNLESALNNLIRLGLLYNEGIGGFPSWVRLSALGKEFYTV